MLSLHLQIKFLIWEMTHDSMQLSKSFPLHSDYQ